MKIFDIFKSDSENKDIVKVLSHPRSGTQFLANFIGHQFYPQSILNSKDTEWGHWSDRRKLSENLVYGKIFQSHAFPVANFLARMQGRRFVYIYRDGRAVAASVWKTDGFFHAKDKGMSFSEFIDHKLDWAASPGRRVEPKVTIAEHWYDHVNSWVEESQKNENLLIVKYEDLVDRPEFVFNAINSKFFKSEIEFKEIPLLSQKVGILPNAATKYSWKSIFKDGDESKFLNYLKCTQYLSEEKQ